MLCLCHLESTNCPLLAIYITCIYSLAHASIWPLLLFFERGSFYAEFFVDFNTFLLLDVILVYNGNLGQSQLSNYGFFAHGEDACWIE